MRPDSILVTAISLTLTSINHVDLIYLAIVIPVILLPVGHFTLCQLHCFTDHLTRMFVLIFRVVTAIIASILAYRYRTNDIEIQFKLPTALGLEIVGDRALELSFREAFLIRYASEQFVGMIILERLITKINQDNQTLLLATIMRRSFCWQTTGTSGVGLLSECLGFF